MSHLSYVIVMNKRKKTFCAEKFEDPGEKKWPRRHFRPGENYGPGENHDQGEKNDPDKNNGTGENYDPGEKYYEGPYF